MGTGDYRTHQAYKPETRSMSSGQVLSEPYTMEKARVVVREMAENIALELVEKKAGGKSSYTYHRI